MGVDGGRGWPTCEKWDFRIDKIAKNRFSQISYIGSRMLGGASGVVPRPLGASATLCAPARLPPTLPEYIIQITFNSTHV